MAVDQSTRELAVVDGPLGKDTLLPRRLRVSDCLSKPFEFELELLSEDLSIKLEDVLGASMTLSLDIAEGKKTRYFNGVVSTFSHVGQVESAAERYTVYKATLRPWLWLLTQTTNCRIFQEKKAPEIIKEVFDGHGFSDIEEKLSATYRKRTYCVQYRETDFNFVCRLMEEEGIYYHFEHDIKKNVLVLCDSVSAHATYSGYAELRYLPPGTVAEHTEKDVYEWDITQELQSGVYSLTDFDFEKPRAELKVESKENRKHKHAKFERYDYPGRYIEKKDGKHYADTRLEALQAGYERVHSESLARGLCAGSLFTLKECPRADQNREYLIVSTELEMTSDVYGAHAARALHRTDAEGERRFTCKFTAIHSKIPFRAPQVTPKAVVMGPQTAVVVGPKGDEIWTDKYGRVKVQFRWDRDGKSDEKSSCWVRTAQVWAGKKWGGIFIPRIGQEVIVEFLEGDPDQPIITGRVYNADQMPPYELPADQTKSGVQTRSTTKGDAQTFNELRFEDKKGQEEIYFHAERDFNRVVENDDNLKVGYDVKDKGQQKIEIYNDQLITIEEGHQKTTLKTGDRIATVQKGDDKVTVSKGNQNITVSQGNQNVKINAGAHLTQAGKSITLKVGGNSIKIDQQGVTIKGMMVKVQGNVKVDVKSPMTTVKGDAMLTLKGGMASLKGGMTIVKGGVTMIN